MADSRWTLNPSNGELHVLTGVTGRAAKMGHRLTIAMEGWQATVDWQGAEPVSAELVVDVDSLAVLKGEGGLTPLAGPEKGVARSNALKSLDVKKFPKITFTATAIGKTSGGYRLTGSLEIHGVTRPQVVDVAADDRGDSWALSTEVHVTQTDFGIKPISLFMGSMKTADEVVITFVGTYPK